MNTPGFTLIGQSTPGFTPVDDSQEPPPSRQGALPEGSYQARKGGPVLNTNDSPLRTAAVQTEKGLGIEPGSDLGDSFAQMGKAFGRFGLSVLKDPLNLGKGIESVASGVEGGAKDIETGLGYRKGDILKPSGPMNSNSISAGFGSLLGLKAQMEGPDAVLKMMTPEVSGAARQIQRYTAINQGQVRTVNAMVRAPLAMLHDRIMGENGEVARHVNAVVGADEADMLSKQNHAGFVKTADAAAQARAMSEKIGGEFATRVGSLIDRASMGAMSMREAKALTTDVGREQAAFERAGKGREAAVLGQLYDGLHQATAERARELGGPYAKSWQHYIDETRAYKDMQGKTLGKLIDQPNHAKALSTLIDRDNAADVQEIVQKMKQYGVDSSAFERAREIGGELDQLTKDVQNSFVGKIRAIMKHPVAAGTAVVGASAVGHASGIPGAGFLLPLLVAGKISGMLDSAQVTRILNEIKKAAPPGAERVSEAGAGPQPTPPGSGPSPTSTPSRPPTPINSAPKFKGGINSAGLEASSKPASLADQIQALKTENYHMKERMRVAGGTDIFPDEEVQQAEQRMEQNNKLIKDLQAAMANKKASGR